MNKKTTPISRAARIFGTSVAMIIILPWQVVLFPVALIGVAADWWTFTMDKWIRNKIAPADAAVKRFAWALGHTVIGRRPYQR